MLFTIDINPIGCYDFVSMGAGNGHPFFGHRIIILKEKYAPKSLGRKAEDSSSGTRNLSGADGVFFLATLYIDERVDTAIM